MPRRQRLSAACSLVATSVLLTACSAAVDAEGGPGGNGQPCRDLVAALPSTLAGAPARATSGAAGTAAWGDPAIVLACGTEPLGPTTLECITVDERVDWVLLAGGNDGAVLTTYGREPAVTVEVPGAYGPAPFVLAELTEAIETVPAGVGCV